MTSLLSLDPGGTTGWALFRYDAVAPLTLLDKGQVEGGVDGFVEWGRALDLRDVDEVVAESFIIDGRTLSPDITPRAIEVAIEFIFGKWGEGCPVTYQRNIMKAHADDLLLKRAGLWFPGQQHARDAARHAVAYMKVTKHIPTMRWLWPPREGVA